MRQHFLAAAIAVLVSLLGANAWADLIVGYDAVDVFPLENKTLAPINGTGVSGSVLSANGLIDRDGGGSNFTWSGFPTGDPSDDQAFNFSITSTTPYDLTTLEFFGVRSSSGPLNLELLVDIGSGYTSVGVLGVPDTAGTMSYNVSGYTGVTSAAFRLRGYGADNSGVNATLSLVDSGNVVGPADLALLGTPASVPEASPFVFGGLICSVLGLWRLRQSRRREEAKA